MKVVEMQDVDYGYRFWSEPMPESEVEAYIEHFRSIGYELSDIDDSTEFEDDDEPFGMTDAEADADTLASAGWGTDEDYGYFGGDEW